MAEDEDTTVRRQPLPPIDPARDTIHFQQIELDHSVEPVDAEFSRENYSFVGSQFRCAGTYGACDHYVWSDRGGKQRAVCYFNSFLVCSPQLPCPRLLPILLCCCPFVIVFPF